MNQEINENEKEKRQPAYRQEAMQRAMGPRIDFSSAGKGIKKAGNALGTSFRDIHNAVQKHMDSFDM